MPYEIKQISPRRYQVINSLTGEIHSKSSTKSNAEKQLHLLNAVEHGWQPTGKKEKLGVNKMANKWITFWAEKSRGKKFASKEERHAFMQKVLNQWRKKRGAGESILLQPGLSSTTGVRLNTI